MLHQLTLGLGDKFFPELHRAYRELKQTDIPTTEEEKKQLFMYMSSKVAGINLTSFFDKWGLNMNDTTRNNIKDLALPSLEAAIWVNGLWPNADENPIRDPNSEAIGKPDLNTSLKLDSNSIRLTLNKATQEGKNRFIINVNGQYVTESYNGHAYYHSQMDKSDPEVNTITRNITLKEGDLVEVYLADGIPGGSINKNDLKLLASTRYKKYQGIGNKVIVSEDYIGIGIDKSIQESNTRIVIYANNKYVAESYNGTTYYSFVDKSDPHTNFIRIEAEKIKNGDNIEVYITAGLPGDDIVNSTGILAHQFTYFSN